MKPVINDLIHDLNKEFKMGLDADLSRTGFAQGILEDETEPRVDAETGVIRGVAVATKGPALGHGLELDDEFLAQVVEAGNQASMGIKARFDHPNMCTTSMGKAIGRFKAFEVDGDVVRADLHLLKAAASAPDGDMRNYLLELAQESPESFGTSIVFENDPVTRVDERGVPLEDEQGEPLPQLARLKKLFAADVVDEPAANPNGFFSSPRSNTLAEKLSGFLDRYLLHKGLTIAPQPQTIPHVKEDSMSKDAPKETPTPEAQATSFSADDVAAARQAERARVKSITEFGRDLQAPSEVIDQLIDEGASVEAAFSALAADAKTRNFFSKQTVSNALGAQDLPGAGGTLEVELSSTTIDPNLPVADQAKQAWAQTPAIREEFLSEEDYVAFRKFEDEGRVKILTK